MKKRILCLLISFSLFLVLYMPALSENVKISFIIQDDGKDILLKSSLLPEGVIPVAHPEGKESGNAFALLYPDLLPELIRGFGEKITEWNKKKASIEKGSFVGDLFEHASEKEVIEIDAKDIDMLIGELAGQLTDPETNNVEDETPAAQNAAYLSAALRSSAGQIFNEETTVRICTFDKNRYFTIDIQNRQDTVVSLSADISQKDSVSLLIVRGAGSAVYYEEINCVSHDTETNYSISLFRSEAPSFRMIKEQECVQFSEIRFDKKSEDTFAFEGEIQSVLLPSAARISGSKGIGENGKGMISVDMAFEEENQEIPVILINVMESIFQP